MSGANNHHTHLYEFTTGNLAKRAATEVVALRPERDAARGYLPAWFHDICSLMSIQKNLPTFQVSVHFLNQNLFGHRQ